MLDFVSITLPIFLLIALGYAATRFEATTPADIRTLGAFVIRFTLPALLFKSLAQRPFAEIANADYLIAYALGSLIAYGAMFALASALRRADVTANAFQALGVFAALLLFPRLDPQLRKSMLIFASAPMLGIYPLLGRAFGFEHLAAASLLTATALSFRTISALLLAL